MIKNFSTGVSPEKTIGEITSLLLAKGARSITTTFDADGVPSGLEFTVEVYGRLQGFSVPVNVEGVAAAMLKAEPWNSRRAHPQMAYVGKVRVQARATAWRILKDWLDSQMAVIEAGQAELPKVFLPYMLAAPNGETMWDAWSSHAQLQLGSGK